MADSNVISFSASDFLQNSSEEAAPITENSVTNVWCNLITTYRSYLSWCGKVVANNSMAVCNQNLNCIKFPLICGDSLGLFDDGCGDKGVGFREDTLPDAVWPLFVPFLVVLLHLGFLRDEGTTCGWLSIMSAFIQKVYAYCLLFAWQYCAFSL